MNPADFARLLVRVEAGGLEAIAGDLDAAAELTHAQAADLVEAHCWFAFPFLCDYVHWLEGRAKARSVECQRHGRCQIGFGQAPCRTCEDFWGRSPLGPQAPEACVNGGDPGVQRVTNPRPAPGRGGERESQQASFHNTGSNPQGDPTAITPLSPLRFACVRPEPPAEVVPPGELYRLRAPSNRRRRPGRL
jgi:hypothetical protein